MFRFTQEYLHWKLIFLFPLKDPYWCALIQYCVMHCANIGCELPSLDDPMIKVSNLLGKVKVKVKLRCFSAKRWDCRNS